LGFGGTEVFSIDGLVQRLDKRHSVWSCRGTWKVQPRGCYSVDLAFLRY
jgi:hypothetical protein